MKIIFITENFLNWSKSISLNQEIKITTTVNKNCPNRSARIDFDGVEKIGRITLWADGNFFSEIIDIESEVTIFQENGEIKMEGDLNLKFNSFLLLLK